MVLLSAAFAVVVSMTGVSADQMLDEVQKTYESAGDISAQFTQTHVDKLRRKERREAGKLWAKEDGRVRWSYLDPVRKDFVYDGNRAYFYEPENAQVTVFDHFSDSPLSHALKFLWGQGNIKERFDAHACQRHCDLAGEGEQVIELVPREEIPTVDYILLIVDPRTRRVTRSVVFDPLGNYTEYRFENVKFNADVPEKKLKFEIPRGVSILRADSEKQQGRTLEK